jgi:WD40 repeat protein
VAGELVTADYAGTLTGWEIATGAVVWRRAIDKQRIDRIAMTPDAELIVATAGPRLHIIRPSPWSHSTVDLPAEIEHIAISTDSRVLAVALADGRLATVDPANSSVITVAGAYADILDLRAQNQDRSVRALVRRSDSHLAVIDATTGREVQEILVGTATVNAALGAEPGSVAVSGPDGELRVGIGGTALAPLGQRVPAILDSLLVLTPDRVVTASSAFGVVAYDRPTGLVLKRLQVAQAGVSLIRSSPDGKYLLCSSGYGLFVWAATELGPVASPATVIRPGSEPEAHIGSTIARGDATGQLTVISNERPTFRAVVTSGAITAVAVSADGTDVLVGSELGEVAEIDVTNKVVVRRWGSPSGGSIDTIGWSLDGSQILIRIAPDLWWSTGACPGCGADAALLAALASRIKGCYQEPNLLYIGEEARQRLNLRVCLPSPNAEKG